MMEPEHGAPAGTRSAEDISLLELLTPLVRRWKLLVGIPIAFGLLAALVSLILPSVYTAQTTLTPVSSSMSGLGGGALTSLAGLAGQLGLATAGSGTVSPDFVADVLESREVLTATLQSRFRTGSSEPRELPLIDILEVAGQTEPMRLSRGVRKLEESVETKVDRSTGIVSLMVEARDPQLAADIANRMRIILNDFNLERRQSQSREQARFTRERLTEAETDLRQAEAAQLRFLQANREYRGSPLLEFEASRHERAVELRQEVYVSLVKAHDEARISEVRDTPVITTIDSAVAPAGRSAPRPVLNVFIALLAGGVVAFVLVYLLEQRAQVARAATPGYRVFRREPAASGRAQ
jgi:uncharacterized protein involved in exopolysaccharide biosynthesis